MTNRHQNRKGAYEYIVEPAKKVNCDLNRNSDKAMAHINYVSLDELEGHKEGRSEPYQELVAALKKLLVAWLVTPKSMSIWLRLCCPKRSFHPAAYIFRQILNLIALNVRYVGVSSPEASQHPEHTLPGTAHTGKRMHSQYDHERQRPCADARIFDLTVKMAY